MQCLVDKEVILNHEFAVSNPEIVLPCESDLCSPGQLSANEDALLSAPVGVQFSLQLPDGEACFTHTPWTLVQNRKKLLSSHDRGILEH